MMNSLEEQLSGVRRTAIAGHIKPDGDCIGSCLAVYNYIKDYHPEIEASLFLEPIPNLFKFLTRADEIINGSEFKESYDLFIVLDCGDTGRLGAAGKLLGQSRRTICIDHHISNGGFGDDSYIFPDASSTSELVFDLMPKERIHKKIAECIYVGIVHDTGMFQYSCTSSKTMRIAGFLMDKGINFPQIVDKTYMEKTYEQNLILARAIEKSRLHLGGRCISSVITPADMAECNVQPKHLEGIVQHLRATKGVEAAVFFYAKSDGDYKISLRSSSDAVNVAAVAMQFGGGGHVRAAGASTDRPPQETLDTIIELIKAQLESAG